MKKHVPEAESEEEVQEEAQEEVVVPSQSELDELIALCDKLNALGVHSISDLEVKIARLQ